MQLKTGAQYKSNILLLTFCSLIVSSAELFSIYILFQKFEAVGHWHFYEASLMFGIITMVFSIVECFGRGFDEFSSLVRKGDLDRFLVRPVGILKQIFGWKVEFSKVGRIIMGLTVSIISLINLNIAWSLSKVIVLILTFICGIFVMFGLELICCTISIFAVENLEFLNILTNGAKELSFYPLDIYNKWITRIVTFVIPLACFNYLPISFLLGYGELPQIIYALSPLFGMIFVIPCLLLFLWSLKKYQSTGT